MRFDGSDGGTQRTKTDLTFNSTIERFVGGFGAKNIKRILLN